MSLRVLDNNDAEIIGLKVLDFIEEEIRKVIIGATSEEEELAMRTMMAGLVVAFSVGLKS